MYVCVAFLCPSPPSPHAVCCLLQPDLLGGAFGLYSPAGQQWLVGDLLRDAPDTPNMMMLQALPEPQRDVLVEAARMFVGSTGCC